MGRSNPLLHAFLLLFAIHIIGLLWSANLQFGLDDLRKKLPLLIVPLVVLTTPKPDKKSLSAILGVYVGTAFVVTIIGSVRFFRFPDLPYREIVPYISHIRFALNLCLCICLLALGCVRHAKWRAAMVILALRFVEFLFLIRSYTGLIVLFAIAVFALFAFWKRIIHKGLRIAFAAALALIVLVGAGVGISLIQDYYRPVPLAQQPLAATTANGRPYQHKQDGLIENGNYVNNYICREELETAWQTKSSLAVSDTTPNGYSIYLTLIRYLNALGTTKDSVGVSQLTETDIAAIEQGIANPVYNQAFPIRKMVYVMLFERECYKHFHSVKDFSVLQRVELWKNGWQVFAAHPLFGVGTGDVVDLCHAQLEASQSELVGTTKHTHNQYLTLLITFGIVGFAVIVWAFGRAFLKGRPMQFFPFFASALIVLLSCLTEDTLETLAGCLFAAFFLSLFYHYTKKEQL